MTYKVLANDYSFFSKFPTFKDFVLFCLDYDGNPIDVPEYGNSSFVMAIAGISIVDARDY